MLSLEEQLKADAAKYQFTILEKFNRFNEKELLKPVSKDAGNAYLEGYRKHNDKPHVIQLTREAIAFLYKQLYDTTVAQGSAMAGNFAVGFANYKSSELRTPSDPQESDPNWDSKKENQNTVILGYWDKVNGVVPFKETIHLDSGSVEVEFYDDWNQEWP